MNRKEYNTIMKLLNSGQIDELREFLDKNVDSKYLVSARKALMDLINSDCIKEYPSYYNRVNNHVGVLKTYKGIFFKTDNGLIITAGDSNLFELCNKNIINEDIDEIIERTCAQYNNNTKIIKERLEILKEIVAVLDEKYTKEVFCSGEEGTLIQAWTDDKKSSVVVPTKYYRLANKLLGKDTLKYTDDKGMGMYLKSDNGKALIMACRK